MGVLACHSDSRLQGLRDWENDPGVNGSQPWTWSKIRGKGQSTSVRHRSAVRGRHRLQTPFTGGSPMLRTFFTQERFVACEDLWLINPRQLDRRPLRAGLSDLRPPTPASGASGPPSASVSRQPTPTEQGAVPS